VLPPSGSGDPLIGSTGGSEPIRTPGGHAASYDETEARLAPVVDRVPITRVHDATALDWIGVPVWAAVTPHALDLTVHAGKGPTPQAARISAIMEAIERVSAEPAEAAEPRIAGYADLVRSGEPVLDPLTFDLPFETVYAPEQPIAWVRGEDLLGGGPTWVARDLVVNPPREGVCTGVETNGLASGNTMTEAVVHALYELIERDAAAHEHFNRRYADGDRMLPMRIVETDSLPDRPAALVTAVEAAGLTLVVRDFTHDLGVPVIHAMLIDPGFSGTGERVGRFVGLGCDLDPASAATRAICEAAQSHTVMVVGARDTFEMTGPPSRGTVDGFIRQLAIPTSSGPLAAVPPDLPVHLNGRLRLLLDRLLAAGFRHCVTVDLTRPELGIPVVRVLVPGLSGPYGESSRRPARRLLRMLV
jgi:YcaO-like protein with predicted kinase domain